MKRTVWIIDGAYLFASAKQIKKHIDYIELRNEMEKLNGQEFDEVYYLNTVSSPQTEQSKNFHNFLKSARPKGAKMRVKLYPLKTQTVHCTNCSTSFEKLVQSGVDVGIATLAIQLAVENEYDRLLLTTGDCDFMDAMTYIQGVLKKEVWVSGFHRSVSPDLQSHASNILFLDEKDDQIFTKKTYYPQPSKE